MSTLVEVKPHEPLLVINLAKEAGIDISDWANFKGGKARAATNPKYCYEWSFVRPGKIVVLNLWHAEMHEADGAVTRQLNLRKSALRETDHNRKRRALRMDDAIRVAYSNQLPIRVIVLDGTKRNANDPKAKVTRTKRLLDPVFWAVTAYDFSTGQCILARGKTPRELEQNFDSDEFQGFEGEARRLFILHRRREAGLRNRKLQEVLRLNEGRLVCEVPNCGFDFAQRYCALGIGYAQVHHKKPISDAPKEGRPVALKELAVVCANCHAMIHKGGACRALDTLISLGP